MPRPKRDVSRMNVYVQNDVRKGLVHLADIKATNVSELVRDALRNYVIAELAAQKTLSLSEDNDGHDDTAQTTAATL